MARVSRKKQNIPATPADTPVRIWKTALYVRLSVEDNGKDSDSVENQTALLEEYVANHPHLKTCTIHLSQHIHNPMLQYRDHTLPAFLSSI